MLENIRRLFPADVYILIGSEHTYVATREEKVLRVPTRVLIKKKSYEVVAFGDEAREVEHAGLAETRILVPFSSTEILDEVAASAFLRSLFRAALGSGFFLKPRVWLGLSHRVSPFMRELWQSVAVAAGAREVITVDHLLAGAFGAELDVWSAHGYALAYEAEGAVDLGLVSYGHTQVQLDFIASENAPKKEYWDLWVQQWQAFLQRVPAEFATSILQEGLLVLTSDSQDQRARELSRMLGVPVIFLQRSVAVAGLRRLASERTEGV